MSFKLNWYFFILKKVRTEDKKPTWFSHVWSKWENTVFEIFMYNAVEYSI